MLLQQKIISIILSIGLIILIFELVRRKKLRPEYSWLWVLTALSILAVSLNYRLLLLLKKVIGVIDPNLALFFLAILFLFLISIHFSIKISVLTEQVKDLIQENAILKTERENKNK